MPHHRSGGCHRSPRGLISSSAPVPLIESPPRPPNYPPRPNCVKNGAMGRKPTDPINIIPIRRDYDVKKSEATQDAARIELLTTAPRPEFH